MNEKELLLRALETLKAKGASGDAWLEHRRSLEIGVRDGALEDIRRSEVRGMGIRAILEERLGFVHTSDLRPERIAEAASTACDLARFATAREDLLLAPPSGPGDGRDEGLALEISDPGIEALPLREKEAWIKEAEKAALGFDPKIRRSDGAGWGETSRSVWFSNTVGLYRHFLRTEVGVAVNVIAEDGEAMQPGNASWEAVRLSEIPEPGVLAKRAGEQAVRLLGGEPVPSGRYPVIFSPYAGWAFLVYLVRALQGDDLSRGRSWLTAREGGWEGARIGSERVTVRDDGRRPGRLGSVPFDGEGVDTQTRALVEKGVVHEGLFDLASARRLGRSPTGNSSRDDYQNLPGIDAHNLYLEPGEASPESILSEVKSGLWVWGLSGWWIGLDPSNPRFSSAVSGIWVKNGQPSRPVARVTVAGSLEEILGGIDAVGNDIVWDHRTKAPTFRVAEVAVSGV